MRGDIARRIALRMNKRKAYEPDEPFEDWPFDYEPERYKDSEFTEDELIAAVMELFIPWDQIWEQDQKLYNELNKKWKALGESASISKEELLSEFPELVDKISVGYKEVIQRYS